MEHHVESTGHTRPPQTANRAHRHRRSRTHVYWPQFEGLKDALHAKQRHFERIVEACGTTVISFGLVDNAESAYQALPLIQAADIDMLFIDMVTYATSSTFGVLARALNIPIVLVALQPLQKLDGHHAHSIGAISDALGIEHVIVQ